MKVRLMTGWLEIGAGFQLLLAAIVTYLQRDTLGIFGMTGSLGAFGSTLMIMAASAVFLLHPSRTLRGIRSGLFLFAGFLATIGAAWLLLAGNFGLAVLQFGYATWLIGASLMPSLDQQVASMDEGHARGINILSGSVLIVIGLKSLTGWSDLVWYDVLAFVFAIAAGSLLVMLELQGYRQQRRTAMVFAALAFLCVSLGTLVAGDWASSSALLLVALLLLLAGLGDISLPEKADDVSFMTPKQLEIHTYERYIEVMVWVSIAFTSAFISILVTFNAWLFFLAVALIAVSIQYFYRLRPAKSTNELRYLQALLTISVLTLMIIASTGGALGPLMYLAFLAIYAGAFVVKPLWPLFISIFYAAYALAELMLHLYVHNDIISDGHLVSFTFIAVTLLLAGFFVALTAYGRRGAESSLVIANQRLASTLSESIKARERSEVQRHELQVLNNNLNEARSSLVGLLEDLEESKSEIEVASGLNVAILNALAEGVVAAGRDGLIFQCNPVAAGIIGKPIEKIVGYKLVDLILLYREGSLEAVNPLSSVEDRAGHIISFGDNLSLQRSDNTRVPVEGKASSIMDANNHAIGIVVAMRDATIERENDKMKSDFISIASHQLRTPISAMRWLLDMLIAGDVGRISPKQKGFLTDLYASVARMTSLIDDLLNISRIESGRANPKFEEISTADFVKSLVREFKPMADAQHINFKFSIDKSATVFRSDSMLAHQVISNLLSNAFKYTPKKGSVMLNVNVDGPETTFVVKDTGMGIAKSEQIHIFEKFFRATNATSIDTTGSGLGLYVAKMITGLLGGKIWFESDDKNGTVFYVALGGRQATLPHTTNSGKIPA